MSWEEDFIDISDEELERIFNRLAEYIIAKVAKRMGMKGLINGQSEEVD